MSSRLIISEIKPNILFFDCWLFPHEYKKLRKKFPDIAKHFQAADNFFSSENWREDDRFHLTYTVTGSFNIEMSIDSLKLIIGRLKLILKMKKHLPDATIIKNLEQDSLILELSNLLGQL